MQYTDRYVNHSNNAVIKDSCENVIHNHESDNQTVTSIQNINNDHKRKPVDVTNQKRNYFKRDLRKYKSITIHINKHKIADEKYIIKTRRKILLDNQISLQENREFLKVGN